MGEYKCLIFSKSLFSYKIKTIDRKLLKNALIEGDDIHQSRIALKKTLLRVSN